VDIRLLIPELFEKLSLIATAGLLGVLVPPLRNRLLGVGRPRDIAVVVIFGLLFSLWGSTMGFEWLGHFLNLRAIGIMIAGILGGPRAGALTGLLGGGFYVTRVVPAEFPWALVASVLDGWLAGRMSVRRGQMFVGWRVLGAAALVQLAGLTVTGAGMAFSGSNPIEALPSLAAQLGGVAVGVALFVNVALVVISRQEQAVALVEAQAAANALSLTALRSRLEPHFLFNALNTLRATIRRDPEQARTLVSDLADLYRYLLHHPHDASVMNEVEHACLLCCSSRSSKTPSNTASPRSKGSGKSRFGHRTLGSGYESKSRTKPTDRIVARLRRALAWHYRPYGSASISNTMGKPTCGFLSWNAVLW
jgi:uncharacterized membrane protein